MNKFYIAVFMLLLILSMTDFAKETMGDAIIYLHSFTYDSYGLAIILITFIFRIIFIPLLIKQVKFGNEITKKMQEAKPDIDALNEKLSQNTDPFEYQKELMKIYKKHNFSPNSLFKNVLPIIIQMPIFFLLYQTIKNNSEILNSQFLNVNLGEFSFIFAIVIFAFYLINSFIQSLSQKSGKAGLFVVPMFIFCFIVFAKINAALSLYWIAGGIFLIFQSIILFFIKKNRHQ